MNEKSCLDKVKLKKDPKVRCISQDFPSVIAPNLSNISNEEMEATFSPVHSGERNREKVPSPKPSKSYQTMSGLVSREKPLLNKVRDDGLGDELDLFGSTKAGFDAMNKKVDKSESVGLDTSLIRDIRKKQAQIFAAIESSPVNFSREIAFEMEDDWNPDEVEKSYIVENDDSLVENECFSCDLFKGRIGYFDRKLNGSQKRKKKENLDMIDTMEKFSSFPKTSNVHNAETISDMSDISSPHLSPIYPQAKESELVPSLKKKIKELTLELNTKNAEFEAFKRNKKEDEDKLKSKYKLVKHSYYRNKDKYKRIFEKLKLAREENESFKRVNEQLLNKNKALSEKITSYARTYQTLKHSYSELETVAIKKLSKISRNQWNQSSCCTKQTQTTFASDWYEDQAISRSNQLNVSSQTHEIQAFDQICQVSPARHSIQVQTDVFSSDSASVLEVDTFEDNVSGDIEFFSIEAINTDRSNRSNAYSTPDLLQQRKELIAKIKASQKKIECASEHIRDISKEAFAHVDFSISMYRKLSKDSLNTEEYTKKLYAALLRTTEENERLKREIGNGASCQESNESNSEFANLSTKVKTPSNDSVKQTISCIFQETNASRQEDQLILPKKRIALGQVQTFEIISNSACQIVVQNGFKWIKLKCHKPSFVGKLKIDSESIIIFAKREDQDSYVPIFFRGKTSQLCFRDLAFKMNFQFRLIGREPFDYSIPGKLRVDFDCPEIVIPQLETKSGDQRSQNLFMERLDGNHCRLEIILATTPLNCNLVSNNSEKQLISQFTTKAIHQSSIKQGLDYPILHADWFVRKRCRLISPQYFSVTAKRETRFVLVLDFAVSVLLRFTAGGEEDLWVKFKESIADSQQSYLYECKFTPPNEGVIIIMKVEEIKESNLHLPLLTYHVT